MWKINSYGIGQFIISREYRGRFSNRTYFELFKMRGQTVIFESRKAAENCLRHI